jgi:AAA domain
MSSTSHPGLPPGSGAPTHPRCAPIAASRQRWKHAQFRGAFSSYTGVDQLVRNFVKSPHKWSLDGDKTYRYLRDHLQEPEAGRPWSRAVSSEGTVEDDPYAAEVLAEFGKVATTLLANSDSKVVQQGLCLLAATSSTVPAGIKVAKALLGSDKAGSITLVGAALDVAGHCFREPGDFAALFQRIDRSGIDKETATALARLVVLRQHALDGLEPARALRWMAALKQLVNKDDTGFATTLSTRAATEAIAAMLRMRRLAPGFLAPDSREASMLRLILVQRHDALSSKDQKEHTITCAALRRLVRYIDGEGRGDVLLQVMADESEPLLTVPEPMTDGPKNKDASDVVDQPKPKPPIQPPTEPRPHQQTVTEPHDAPGAETVSDGRQMEPDPDQRAVIEAAPSEFLLVIAPPGAGKTAVACARVAWLAQNEVPPASMLMISFTRVAVAEFKERVKKLAPDVPDIHGVEVSTLDSLAYRILKGLDEDADQDSLMGGYEQNIERATQKIRSGDAAICDWIRHYQHILIDEAQDLVGVRAKLVTEILRCRASECGATVFGDPAQAIYGFTTEDDEDGSASMSFFEALEQAGLEPRTLKLTHIHRTDSRKLKGLFLQGRMPLAGGVAEPRVAWERARELIEQHADEDIGNQDGLTATLLDLDALVLFRSRAQVLLSSSLLHRDGIAHRIRMSGTPMVIEPWIGFLLRDFDKALLLRSDLAQRWDARAGHPCLSVNRRDLDSAWSVLRELAPGNRQGVDMPVLRKLLSRSRPPIQVATPELGTRGPILGTVHASKGREASDVIFMLPPEKSNHDKTDYLEEGRVLYVGATRAVRSLRIGAAAAAHSSRMNDGRVYRKSPKDGLRPQLEIGREGDIDPHGSVAQSIHDADVAHAQQEWLAAQADKTIKVIGHDQLKNGTYRILTEAEPQACIGAFSQRFRSDLLSVARQCGYRNVRPTDLIKHLYMVGVTTVAVDRDDPRLPELHEPYATSGLFLAPVVRGLTTIQFLTNRDFPTTQW